MAASSGMCLVNGSGGIQEARKFVRSAWLSIKDRLFTSGAERALSLLFCFSNVVRPCIGGPFLRFENHPAGKA